MQKNANELSTLACKSLNLDVAIKLLQDNIATKESTVGCEIVFEDLLSVVTILQNYKFNAVQREVAARYIEATHKFAWEMLLADGNVHVIRKILGLPPLGEWRPGQRHDL